jgi:hypothetical protein
MPEFEDAGPSPDDLSALADAVREAGKVRRPAEPPTVTETARRGHLRVLRADDPPSA